MTTISAKVIQDSISPDGIRLTALSLVYPAFFHQDFMTHRVFSRNASSTRAIPMKKMLANIRRDMAMPIHWGINQPGMQAKQQLTGWRLLAAKALWRLAGHSAMFLAKQLERIGAHKQVGNMILWPFMHFNTIVSSTEWDNFFELRDHEDARPEIQKLAQEIKAAMERSVPVVLKAGQWHLPYVYAEDGQMCDLDQQKKISAARCARVSYLTHEGRVPDVDEDLGLFDRLVGSRPLHASPTEHQATPDKKVRGKWKHPELHGNFTGWIQQRKQLEQEIWRDK